MAEPKLVDMAKTKAELKEEKRGFDVSYSPNKYPYGLSISLGKDELAKLGIKDLPHVGAELQLVAIARVTNVSSNASEDQEESTCCGLQLVKMAIAVPERTDSKGSSGLMGYFGKG